jgi:hypothetical protein
MMGTNTVSKRDGSIGFSGKSALGLQMERRKKRKKGW